MLRNITTREFISFLVIIVIATAVGVLLPRVLPTLKAGENWIQDFRFGTLSPPEPQNPDVVIIAITEDTLATLPYRSPIDRGFLVNLLGVLEAAKPRAIGIDILFDQPTEPAKDEALRQKLATFSVPVVVAVAGQDAGLTKPQLAYLKHFTKDLNTGLVNLVKDRSDGTVRWIFPGRTIGGIRMPGFAGALAKGHDHPISEQYLPMVYRVGPDDATPAFPIFPAHAAAVLPKDWFAGKIILIGANLPHADRSRTPFAAALGHQAGSLPGVVIHAQAVAQLLDGRTPPDMDETGATGLIFLLAGLAILLATIDVPLVAKALLNFAVLVVLWISGFALYRYGGTMIPLLAPTISFTLSSSMGVAFLGRRDRKQKKFIREIFSRYVSPSIVNQLVADPGRLNVGGEKRELTYLFTDLANFTSFTERTEPQVLVPLLNEYLSGMCRILFKHGATMDKIVGDAVVGFFNAPVDQEDHHARAVAAALELDEFAQKFVEQQAEKGLTLGITRIGVHSGIAVIGNFGSEQFFDYTAHGDMVNTAARLESVNKHLGTRVCISGVTAKDYLETAFRPIGALILKGKTEGIEVFEPLRDGENESPATAAYRGAFELLRRGDSGAGEGFQEVLRINPEDPLAKFHLRRLENGETGVTIRMGEK